MTIAAGKTPYHTYFPGSAMSPEAIPFEYLDGADISVSVVNGAALAEGVHYQLGGDGRTGTGTITALIDAGSAEWELWSETPTQQQIDLAESRKVPLPQYERELDRAAIRTRENAFNIDRAPKVPRGESIGPMPALSQRKGSLLGAASAIAYAAYDADGNPTVDTPDNFAAPAAAQADRASLEANRAQTNAGYTEEFLQGISYASQAAGEAATSEGQFFRVPIGTTPETYTRYQRTAGGSVVVAPLASTAALASPAPGEGASMLVLEGGGTAQEALDFVIPSGLTHTAVQAAIDTGRTVYLGNQTKTYAIGAPLTMNAGQRIFADGAILQASAVINEILVAANFAEIEGITFDCNNTQPASGVPITQTGAARGVQIRDVTGCRFRRCLFTKYVRGVSVTSSAEGVKCYDHVFENCVAEAGYTWTSARSSNVQLGAYVGSEANPVVTDIANYSTVEADCEDVYDIRFIGWRAFEGQYGLALHRCSNVSVVGGSFTRMSRGISVQHQSRGITITGNVFVNLDSTGIHMSQGANQISVVGNRVRGTMANDNVGIQAYYGCHDITIADNLIDSRFDLWDGGVSAETRSPGAGIRLGQQVENVTVRGNKIRGFAAGILLKSTIYESTINPADDNYYNTGFRNVTIAGNTIIGDYFGAASGYKAAFLQNGCYGIRLQISGSWEDTAQGGWNVSGVVISENESDGVGYSYVMDTATMSGGATPPKYLNFGVRLFNNQAANDLLNVSRSTIATPLSVVYEGNSWRDEQNWTPTLIGTTTPGAQTYTAQVGRWVARGGRIILQGRIALSAKDAGIAGNAVIGGLPAGIKSGGNENRAGSVSLWGGWTLAASYTNLGVFAEPGTSHLRIVRNGSGVSAGYPAVSEMGAAAQIDFTCEYEPAAA